MRFFQPLLAAVILSSLASCQSSTSEAVAPAATPKNYLRFTFDGQTKEYTNVSLSVGQLGAIKSYEIAGTSLAEEDMSLTVFGSAAGSFPYRPSLNLYDNVSQVEFRSRGTVFNNYKALVCPASAGYYSTPGQVVVTEYVPGKLARGTFSGALLDANDPDECNKQGKAFSGEFYVTKD